MAQCLIVTSNLWEAVPMLPLMAPLAFEELEEDDKHHYLNLHADHPEGDDVFIAPQLELHRRVERRVNLD